jgi:CubicO group peptidase (beta-lactamase class C family)
MLRFGMYMLNEGRIHGTETLPDGWIGDATTPKVIGGEPVDYGYMWWPLDDGAYTAIGIFGQYVFVHPESRVVIAMWGAEPKPTGTDIIEPADFFDAIVRELR